MLILSDRPKVSRQRGSLLDDVLDFIEEPAPVNPPKQFPRGVLCHASIVTLTRSMDATAERALNSMASMYKAL